MGQKASRAIECLCVKTSAHQRTRYPYSAEFRRQTVCAYLQSSMGCVAFCKQSGLLMSTIQHWDRELRESPSHNCGCSHDKRRKDPCFGGGECPSKARISNSDQGAQESGSPRSCVGDLDRSRRRNTRYLNTKKADTKQTPNNK